MVTITLFSLADSAAAGQDRSLSLQGFTGIFNTPTGHVQDEGSINALYSNQRERYLNNEIPPWQDNYLFSVGMFSFAEIGGRLTAPNNIIGATGSDLSVNVKISTAPFTMQLPFSPALALGIQDMGGGHSLFRSTYLAASADPLPRLRLSAGYGLGPDRMKGAFGGVELKAHDWVTLLGEYDTRDSNAGLRLTAPPLPWFPASLTFTAKTPLNRSTGIDIAFGLNMPLDSKKQMRDEKKEEAMRDEGLGLIPQPSSSDSLSSVRSRLIAAGFANVRVGSAEERVLVVEYENVRYNHNELDALGVAAGIASSTAQEHFDTLWLVVKRKGLRIIRVSVPFGELRLWLNGAAGITAPSLQVTADTSAVAAARFMEGDSNPDWLKPSLIIYPGLKTYVGTEAAVFDVLLSVKPDLQMTLWKGGVLNARWDIPVAWSDNFDNDHVFASDRNNAQLDRLMLFQGINLSPGLIANLGAGMILRGANGTLNELAWSPGSGRHGFRLTQGYARNSSGSSVSRIWLASYRLYVAPLDLFIDGTAGRFWGGDTGGVVTIKRFFGDTAVDLYVKSTETRNNRHWNAAGIMFSFPLTPGRDMKREHLQVRGADEWSYAQETVLAIGSQKSNDTVSAGLAFYPLPSPNIYRSYLNRDRLNEEYISGHLQKLKDAWLKFRDTASAASPSF